MSKQYLPFLLIVGCFPYLYAKRTASGGSGVSPKGLHLAPSTTVIMNYNNLANVHAQLCHYFAAGYYSRAVQPARRIAGPYTTGSSRSNVLAHLLWIAWTGFLKSSHAFARRLRWMCCTKLSASLQKLCHLHTNIKLFDNLIVNFCYFRSLENLILAFACL